jgi:hypothetical protein
LHCFSKQAHYKPLFNRIEGIISLKSLALDLKALHRFESLQGIYKTCCKARLLGVRSDNTIYLFDILGKMQPTSSDQSGICLEINPLERKKKKVNPDQGCHFLDQCSRPNKVKSDNFIAN